MYNDFLRKGFNIKNNFIRSIKPLKTEYTICVKHLNGNVVEHKNITNPWRYLNAIKKYVDVTDAWIKEE